MPAYCYAVEYYGFEINKFRHIWAYNIVLKSLEYWKNNYLKDEILSGMPGWYFLDWDKQDILVTDKNRTIIFRIQYVMLSIMRYVVN